MKLPPRTLLRRVGQNGYVSSGDAGTSAADVLQIPNQTIYGTPEAQATTPLPAPTSASTTTNVLMGTTGIGASVWLLLVAIGIGTAITVVSERGKARARRARRRPTSRRSRRRNPYELVVVTPHSRYRREFASRQAADQAAAFVRRRLKKIGLHKGCSVHVEKS